MKRRNYKFYIRKTHRYLGIFIGIQFLLWTLGGLYFSWTNIKEIRGEHLRSKKAEINFDRDFISPTRAIKTIRAFGFDEKIKSVKLTEVDNVIYYEIEVDAKKRRFSLINAIDGRAIDNFGEEAAKKIASDALIKPLKVKETQYLTKKNVSSHHEYREKPLPAWAVTYENNLTVYVSAENGQIGAFRTDKWRVFDLLWMLHTMDFYGRDDINNYILRAFSILGILTILSGFILFFVSSRFFRRIFL